MQPDFGVLMFFSSGFKTLMVKMVVDLCTFADQGIPFKTKYAKLNLADVKNHIMHSQSYYFLIRYPSLVYMHVDSLQMSVLNLALRRSDSLNLS